MQTARPMTMGGGTTLMARPPTVPTGSRTQSIYSLIKQGSFEELVPILLRELENFPRSRAALSLLAYSYYNLQDFEQAVVMYERLCKLVPESQEYMLYHGQALFKCGQYAEAIKVLSNVKDEEFTTRVEKLLSSIKYEQDDLVGTQSHLEKIPSPDPDQIILKGCVLYKEGKLDEANEQFGEAMQSLGFRPPVVYNIALCHYRLKQYGPCLKHIAQIIEKGIKDNGNLCIGANSGMDVQSVGNSQELRDSALVEAFNLKAVIEFELKNLQSAKEALTDMPPRSENELDPVTLHNTALMKMDDDPSGGFAKLNFLLQNPPFPPETFHNLLILYVKYQYFDLAADVMADNAQLTIQFLSQDLYDFLDGCLTCQTSPEEAYRKFDQLSQKNIDNLRKLTKLIQEKKVEQDTEAVKKALREYDESLEQYIPVLMAQAKIYWDRDHYSMVEKIFRQSAEFTSEHETWKLNVAHTFFMTETNFEDAIRYYAPIVEKYGDGQGGLLQCSAIILANLCVAYIMTNKNPQAEEIMQRVEKEEDMEKDQDPEKQPLHLCIINMVIGTLYCAKGNFEFGIGRIIKALEPYSKKIMTDTWFYAKRCFLALAETLAKHMIMLKDVTYQEILQFFDAAELHGRKVPVVIHMDPAQQDNSVKNTVRYEARVFKKLFLRLHE